MNKRKHRKQYKKGYKKYFLSLIIVILIIFSGRIIISQYFGQQYSPVSAKKHDSKSGALTDTVDLENLYSPYAILVDLDSGKIIGKHNEEERIYPASLTKIMTAVLAIENTDDLDETIAMPTDFFRQLYKENASMAGFEPGETVRLKDLIYGILLPSGAECCIAYADRISDSEKAFVKLMNQKAQSLGMKNTHFCNSTGLHDDEHYSTVKDISVLLQYALKNENFKTAFCSQYYNTMPSDRHPDGITFYSTMFKYMDTPEVTGGGILGGKTGYTEEAGLCLASIAEINGKEYMLVTAKANGNHQTEQFHISDAVNVYNQVLLGDG